MLVVLAVVILFAAPAPPRRRAGHRLRCPARPASAIARPRRPPAAEAAATHRHARSSAAAVLERREAATAGRRRRAGAGPAVGPAGPRGARRQPAPVPEPRHRRRLRARPGRLRRRGARLPVAAARAAASAPRSRVGKITDIEAEITQGSGFDYYPEGRMWITEYPASALDKAKQGVLGARAGRHGGRRGRPLPEVRAPRLPGAGVPHLAVVRVPVPRLAVQPGRREEGRPGAPRPRPLRHGRRGRRPHRQHRQIILGPPIGTNTTGQEAEGPHCISGGGGAH